MASTPEEWDAKHRMAAREAAEASVGILCELLPLLDTMEARQGSGVKPLLHRAALDLACGRGRNAILLAEHGRHVTAVDWSAAALGILEDRAHELKIPVRRIQKIEEGKQAERAGIDLLQADLETIQLPANRYGLILCVRYLQRSLFPPMARALRPGGMLLFETYTQAQLEFCGGPRDPAHLLKAGELREAFPELEVFFYRELRAGQGIASLAARKPPDLSASGRRRLRPEGGDDNNSG
jgi:tellurite methyltransferase